MPGSTRAFAMDDPIASLVSPSKTGYCTKKTGMNKRATIHVELPAASLAPARAAIRSDAHPLRALLVLLARDRGGLIGLLLFLLVIGAALFAPWLALHDPLDQELKAGRLPPAWMAGGDPIYPLGTDTLGRDLYSRILYGARVSLTVGFFGVL